MLDEPNILISTGLVEFSCKLFPIDSPLRLLVNGLRSIRSFVVWLLVSSACFPCCFEARQIFPGMPGEGAGWPALAYATISDPFLYSAPFLKPLSRKTS